MYKYLGLILLLVFSIRVSAQTEWNFTTSNEGWTLTNSLSGSGGSGVLNLTTTGNDPYMHSPANLGINASIIKTIKINAKNSTNQSAFQVYWITEADQTWNGTKMVNVNLTANSGTFKEYIFDFSSVSAWQGTIKQIRIDPGNPVTGSTFAIDYISLTNDLYTLVADNGTLKVKVDLLRGGAISYLSKSSDNNNLINIYDRGRYIQQSYYAGNQIDRSAEGQHPSWSPWNWNPIQVGDVYNHSSPVLASSQADNTIYTKTQPLLWDMNNELAQCYMEMWLTLQGNTVHVKNKVQVFRTDNLWTAVPRHQELPAVYIIGDLNNLYTYKGAAPFTSDAVEKVVNSGPPWVYWNSPEHWAALVNSNNWGVGVYNNLSTYFVGGYHGTAGGGATSSSTGYMSPLRTETFDKNTVYEYEYDLIVGTLSEIRQFAYSKENLTLPVNFKEVYFRRGGGQLSIFWETLNELNLTAFEVQRSVDGKNFSAVSSIPPKGNHGELQVYCFDDLQPLHSTVYYRIAALNNDGTSEYSKVIAVDGSKSALFTIANPAKDIISINFRQPFTGEVVLVSFSGKILSKTMVKNQSGISSVSLPAGTKGGVIVTLNGNTGRYAEKVIVE